MSAILISDVSVRDPDAFERYRALAASSIEAHGGRYLVRGGEIRVLEGDRHPSAIVVVEFPTLEAAERWYASPEYAEALALRDAALSRSLLLVDGAALPNAP